MRRSLDISGRVEFEESVLRRMNGLFCSWSLCLEMKAGILLHSAWNRRNEGVPFAVADRHWGIRWGSSSWVHRASVAFAHIGLHLSWSKSDIRRADHHKMWT